MFNYDYYVKQRNPVYEVSSVAAPLIYLNASNNVRIGELVYFENGARGIVFSTDANYTIVLRLTHDIIRINEKCVLSKAIFNFTIDDDCLGQVLDPFGHSYYSKNSYFKESTESALGIFRQAPGLSERESIDQTFYTGLSVVDLMMPLGVGQRQLLIGDKKTGKTSFALQVVLNHVKDGGICVYCCIGKRKGAIKEVESFLTEKDVLDKCVMVATSADDALGLIHLTPYVAMSVAEELRLSDTSVLLVLDDMSSHAMYYREISLLASMFPGRDSYPGDIFYTHASLLERAGNFTKGSITCLPIVNTIEGDLSGYIQTNLMSMTDGHLFFDNELFYEGQRPAINVYLSVTRVGRQTQSPLRWSINRELESFFALHKKTENFVHFGAELNEGIKSTLNTGKRIRHFFKQTGDQIYSPTIQIALFTAIWSNIWLNKTDDEYEKSLIQFKTLLTTNKDYEKQFEKIISNSNSFNDLLGGFMKEFVAKKVVS